MLHDTQPLLDNSNNFLQKKPQKTIWYLFTIRVNVLILPQFVVVHTCHQT